MTAAIAFDLFLDEYQAEIDQKENSTTFPMGYIITENDFKHWTNSKNGLAVVKGGSDFSKIKSYKNKGFKNGFSEIKIAKNQNTEIENLKIKKVNLEGSQYENQNYVFVKFTNQKFKNENANLEKEMTKAYMKLLS